jgi:Methyltransferase domain
VTKLPKMYTEVAGWFHLLTAPFEYEEEAEQYASLIKAHSHIPVGTVLEMGSGGGNNASHMKSHFELTLTDLSPQMIELSKTLNPELEHIEGDMRTLRLDREFDAVFIHDAIAYITTEDDLRATIETAFLHCRPGGVALFAPDSVTELFEPRTEHGGHDADGKGMRYLEWDWDPDPSDSTYLVDFAYLIRNENDEVEVVHDRHEVGLFPRRTWMDLLTGAGFEAQRVVDNLDDVVRDIFIGVRPS